MLIKTPLLHQSSGPRVFLSLSLLGYFFGAQRPSEFTFLPGLLRPSRDGALRLHPIERAPEASVNRASPVPGALLAFWVNQGISASFSPLLSYRRLRTTKFWSIKGPQQQKTTYCLIPFMWNIQNRQIHGARKKWFPGFDERGEQGITAYVTRVSI